MGIQPESAATRTLRERLRRAYLSADRIVVLDEDMQERLMGWGIPSNRFVVIPNWIDTRLVAPVKENNAFRQRHKLEGRFVVMHSGNMGLTQRLDILVQAAARDDWPAGALLLLVGGGARTAELQMQVARLNIAHRVQFLPYQPKELLGESLSAADIQVISMDGSIRGCLSPSKLYGILASGTASLALVPPGGAVQRLIDENSVGYCREPNNEAAVVEGVRHAMDNPRQLAQYGRNARRLALERFDRSTACARFKSLFNELLRVR